ncbi:MAG: hypothetical protein AB8G15_02215 [Saprospiraceae bacterium]
MKIDKKITALIGAIQRLEMCKAYRKELQRKIAAGKRKLAMFELKEDKLYQRIKKLEQNPMRSLFTGKSKKKKEREDRLSEAYYVLTLDKKECEKTIALLGFELTLMEEKIAQEATLKVALRLAFLERADQIKASNAPILKKILKIYKRKDKLLHAKVEIAEIILAGETVEDLINQILYNIENNLEKVYPKGDRNIFYQPQEVEEMAPLIEIRELSHSLKQALRDMKKEVAEVYEEKEIELVYPHHHRAYLTTIYNGELSAKHLLRQNIDHADVELLKEVLHDIWAINELFEKELTLLEMEMEDLQTKAFELLMKSK